MKNSLHSNHHFADRTVMTDGKSAVRGDYLAAGARSGKSLPAVNQAMMS
jgi:hypothetical protein